MKPLSITGLTVRFGGLVAVDGLTFDVDEGSILGIIGPNGAGKTTMFDAISGLAPVESGMIHLGETDVTHLTPHERASIGLGRSFQDGRLFGSLTVEECIVVGLSRHEPVSGPLSIAFGGPLARRATKKAHTRAREVIELTGLEPYADTYIRELSTGTRRIVDFACAVAHGPSVLLLDEPSSGIAQKEVDQLGPLLLKLRADTACTMLLIEHDIKLVTEVSDELLVLETGKLLTKGRPDDVVRDPEVIRAYLGTDRDLAKVVGGRSD
jgi:ABC-type branched-subunit amino acid transport system ATPase component